MLSQSENFFSLDKTRFERRAVSSRWPVANPLTAATGEQSLSRDKCGRSGAGSGLAGATRSNNLSLEKRAGAGTGVHRLNHPHWELVRSIAVYLA